MMRIMPSKPRLDHILTAVLAIFVVISLAFSAMIWTGTPVRLTIDRLGFFSSPSYGNTKQPSLVLQPRAIFYWTQGNELYRIGANSETAHQLLRALANTTIAPGKSYGISSSPYAFPPEGAYIRLNFGASVLAPSVLSMLFLATPANLETAVDGSLYITAHGHEFRLEYQTANHHEYVAVLQAPQTLAALMTKPDQALPYAQIPLAKTIAYLPYTTINMPMEDWMIDRPVSSHIIDSFFLDPTLLETVTSAPHDVLYTDGMRGVQVTRGVFGDNISYAEPSGRLVGVPEHSADAVATAVTFVNEHGGFVGDVSLQIKPATMAKGGYDITFTQMVDGWPVYGELGTVHVNVFGNTVVNMSRPLAYLNGLLDTTSTHVLSGTAVLQKLGPAAVKSIVKIALGYGTRWLGTDIVELVPVYCLTYGTGRKDYVDAQTGLPFSGTGMN